MSKKIDHINAGLDLLISQYVTKPIAKGLVETYMNELNPTENGSFEVLNDVLSLDTAVGQQLDVLGSILGVPRSGRPDVYYRRLLKTHTVAISSAGKSEDFYKIVIAMQGTPFNKFNKLQTLELGRGKGKQIELHVTTNQTNEYEAPTPFDIYDAQIELASSKGTGETLQTIWSTVRVGSITADNTALLVSAPTGIVEPGVINGWGYDISGSNPPAGEMACRLENTPNFIEPGSMVEIAAPFLMISDASDVTSLWKEGGSFPLVLGTYSSPPDSWTFTFLRDGVAFGPLTNATYDEVQNYALQANDLQHKWSVEYNVSGFFTSFSGTTPEIYGPLSIYDETGIYGHWNFLNAEWIDHNTGLVRTDTDHVTVLDSWHKIKNQVPGMDPNERIFLESALINRPLVEFDEYDGGIKKPIGGFAGNHGMAYSKDGGATFGDLLPTPVTVMFLYEQIPPQTSNNAATHGGRIQIAGSTQSWVKNWYRTSTPLIIFMNGTAGTFARGTSTMTSGKAAMLYKEKPNGFVNRWLKNNYSLPNTPLFNGPDPMPIYALGSLGAEAVINNDAVSSFHNTVPTRFTGRIRDMIVITGDTTEPINTETTRRIAAYLKHQWGMDIPTN